MNKKRLSQIIVVGVVVFIVLGACATTPTSPYATYTQFQDETVSWQEQAMVFMYSEDGYVYQLEVDGKKGGMRLPRLRIIPAGTHTLKVWLSSNENRGGLIREFTYDFQSGGRYVVVGTLQTITGLLGRIGTTSMKIVPLDEFRAEWEALSAIREKRTAERNDADYKKMVLDYFTDAENVLNAATQ